MPYKIITLTFDPTTGGFDDGPLNSFLTNKTVRRIEPGFFHHDGRAFWSVWIDYDNVLNATESRKSSIPLSDPEKILLQKLQNWRKERAGKGDMAAYIIATNRELEAIVQEKPRTLESLRTIQGFGAKKIQSYGQEITGIITSFYQKPAAENQKDKPKENVNETGETATSGDGNAG